MVAQTRPRHALCPQVSRQDGQERRVLASSLDALAAERERFLVLPMPVPHETEKAHGIALQRDVMS